MESHERYILASAWPQDSHRVTTGQLEESDGPHYWPSVTATDSERNRTILATLCSP